MTWKALATMAVAFAVVSCAQPLPSDPLPELTFAHLEPIELAVGSIEIVEVYIPPLKAPNVEHTFSISPQDAARRWAEQKLRAVGGDGQARFLIQDAAVVETALETEEGIRGAFTTNQSERYDATIEVTLEIRDDRGFQRAFATARAERSQTVPEDLTVRERQIAFFELTEGLMADLIAELETQVGQHLSTYVR